MVQAVVLKVWLLEHGSRTGHLSKMHVLSLTADMPNQTLRGGAL